MIYQTLLKLADLACRVLHACAAFGILIYTVCLLLAVAGYLPADKGAAVALQLIDSLIVLALVKAWFKYRHPALN